jgi:hypothetical protein
MHEYEQMVEAWVKPVPGDELQPIGRKNSGRLRGFEAVVLFDRHPVDHFSDFRTVSI